jgi:DNA-binding Lrp family transcriptional regulator
MLRHLGLQSSAFFPLRRTVVFKTGLELDFERRRNISGEHTPPVTASVDLDSDAKAVLSVLQAPLDLVRTPFRYLARMGGVDEGSLLEFAQDQLGSTIRRYGASFDQVHVGVRDATILWNVNPRQLTKVGRALAAVPEVSTCEARQALPAFPYLLHTVVHTPDRASCEAIAQDVSKRLGIDDYCIVFTSMEYKKTRPRYFEADPVTLAHVNPVSAEDSSVATRS